MEFFISKHSAKFRNPYFAKVTQEEPMNYAANGLPSEALAKFGTLDALSFEHFMKWLGHLMNAYNKPT